MAVDMIHLDHLEIQDFFEVEPDGEDIPEIYDNEDEADNDENENTGPASLDELMKRIEEHIEELKSMDPDDE